MNMLRYEALVTETDGKGRAKVKILESGWEPDVFLMCATTVYGEGKEGFHGKLAEGDLVIVSFFDYPINERPFIEYKMQSSEDRIEVTDERKFMFHEHEFIFEGDKVTIKLKNGTDLVIKDGVIEASSPVPFGDITFGGLGLFQFLATIVCVGNLGQPAPLDPTLLTQISDAILNSTTIKFGV